MKSFEIKLGKGRKPLSLDAAKLINGRCLIQGKSGSGKSYLARVVVEQAILQGIQTIILDHDGEFPSLREKCNVLIAGRGGDVPSEVRSAKLLARRIAETGVSAVVDISDLKMADAGRSPRKEFVSIFVDTLNTLPKRLEGVRIVVVDEAHVYCPESGKGKSPAAEAIVTLMSNGRKRGLCGMLLTQRLSKLRKDAAAECNNVFVGLTSPIDLSSAQDMLGITKQEREELRALASGEFFGTGPALSDPDVVRFQSREAITTHPEAGMRHKMVTPPRKASIDKILKEFEALPPDKAVEDAMSLEEARATIRRLEREISRSHKVSQRVSEPASQDVEAAAMRIVAKHTRGIEKECKRQLQTVNATIRSLIADGKREIDSVLTLMSKSATTALAGVDVRSDVTVTPPAQERSRRTNQATRTKRSVNGVSGDSQLGGGMRRIMIAVAETGGASRTEVAIISHMTPGSGTYSTYLGRLRTAGYLTQDGDKLVATEAGLEALGEYEEIPIGGRDLVESWAPELGSGGIRRLFDALADAGMDGLSRDALAEQAGLEPSSGTYSTYLGKLRKKGLTVDRWPLCLHSIFFWEDHG